MSGAAVIRITSGAGSFGQDKMTSNSLSQRILNTWRRNWRLKQQDGVTVVHVGSLSGADGHSRLPIPDSTDKSSEPEPSKSCGDFRTILHIRSDSGDGSMATPTEEGRTIISVNPCTSNSDAESSRISSPAECSRRGAQNGDVSLADLPDVSSLDRACASDQQRVSVSPETPEKTFPPDTSDLLDRRSDRSSNVCQNSADRNLPFAEHVRPYVNPQHCHELRVTENRPGCCRTVSALRWFVLTLSVLGLCCVLIGILLGALTVTGSARLTICLLMIGVGVVLITVSGVAWRLTSLDPRQPISCRALLGMHTPRNRSSLARPLFPPRHNSRRDNVYFQPPPPAIPPEFIWRPPPPSYQASTQEQMLRSFLEAHAVEYRRRAGSPPPTYRSYPSPMPSVSVAQLSLNTQRRPSTVPNIAQSGPAINLSSSSSALTESHNDVNDSNNDTIDPSNDVIGPPSQATPNTTEQPLNVSHISVVDCSGSTPRGFRVDRDLPPPYPYGPRHPFVVLSPPRGPLVRIPRPSMIRQPVFTLPSSYSSYV